MNRENLEELLYQTLEVEQGGVKVYQAALSCALDPDLKQEWETFHQQTREHVEILGDLFQVFKLDESHETPGRKIVQLKAQALVAAIEEARSSGRLEEAQIVAAECVVDAETKDHMCWELLHECVEELSGEERSSLKKAVDKIELEEDEHLFRTRGWARELAIQQLGMPAVIPPPEDREQVESEAEAVKAKQRRARMVGRRGPSGAGAVKRAVRGVGRAAKR